MVALSPTLKGNMNRARIAAACLLALAGLLFACESETGPDAPKRTSGCIDVDCNPSTPKVDAGNDGG